MTYVQCQFIKLCVIFPQEKTPLPQDSVYVLLPLDAQKEKHFEEKFAKEQHTTFWYQDEKGIVSPAHLTAPHTLYFPLISLRNWFHHSLIHHLSHQVMTLTWRAINLALMTPGHWGKSTRSRT